MRRLVVCCVSLLAACAALGQSPGDFAFRLPVRAEGEHAFLRLEIPDAVYEGIVRADLGDLRLFNGDGEIVPYAFVPRATPVATASPRRTLAIFPLTVDTTLPDAADLSIKLRRDASGTTVDVRSRDGAPVAGPRVVGYLVDAGEGDKPLVGLRLDLREAGQVNARVRVDASDDLDRWRTIVASAPLLSLEWNGRRLTRDRVEFSPQRGRYLRLSWLTPSPPALQAVQGDVGDVVVEPPRRTRRAAGSVDPADANAYLFDLGATVPIDRVTLALLQVNTVAPIAWQGRVRVDEPWRALGNSVMYRLRQDQGEAVNDDFAISAVALRYFRARVDPNAGGVGREAPTLVASWVPQEIVFAARGQPPFELAYGSRRIAPAAMPIPTLVPGYMIGKPLPGNIGVASPSPAPSAANAAALREPLDVKRLALWGSLVLAALLLGYMALRLAQQMRSAEAPTNAPPAKPEEPAS